MDSTQFYVVEYPSFYGDRKMECMRVTEDELIQFVNKDSVTVYRVLDEPLVIKADLRLEGKEEVIDEAVDAAEVQTELPIPPDVVG